jgi:hypothetical protein
LIHPFLPTFLSSFLPSFPSFLPRYQFLKADYDRGVIYVTSESHPSHLKLPRDVSIELVIAEGLVANGMPAAEAREKVHLLLTLCEFQMFDQVRHFPPGLYWGNAKLCNSCGYSGWGDVKLKNRRVAFRRETGHFQTTQHTFPSHDGVRPPFAL